MDVSRRNFLKTCGGAAVGGVLVYSNVPGMVSKIVRPGATGPEPQNLVSTNSNHKWRFVVDTRKCIGCGRCVKACKLENNVRMEPEFNRTWVERYVIADNDEIYVDSPDAGINGFTAEYTNKKYQNLKIKKSFFVAKLCNQCEKPACVQVCPVAATYATPEGVVLVDRKACIGCRYCVQACPYGARYFDPELRIVDKCTWCYHRTTKGLMPACVEVCPVKARNFGDINDPTSTVSKMLDTESVAVLKPDLGTEPMVYYVGLQQGVR